MDSFELQTFKNGQWTVDSYYDDRDLALSEAERLNETGRHAGVRVLREEFHEPTNTSNYHIIFSKLLKDKANKEDRRIQTKKEGRQSGKGAGKASGSRALRRAPTKEDSRGVAMPVVIAVCLLIAGVGAMFVLESDLDFSAAINSLVGSDGSK